ncbi:MAG: antirestriction protein ArdA [Pseudomonadota bacterium]|nr:antirestriction protein ArdA [Pseudomonadota bacterium]
MASARIYVACLAAYNNGKLHGRWIDVTDPETVHEEIKAMLAESPEPGAEEWAVHDYEGIPDSLARSWGEYPDLEAICAFAEACDVLNSYEAEAFEIWYCDRGDTRETNVYTLTEAFREAYEGHYDTPEAFGWEFVDRYDLLRGMPEHLHPYFDYSAFARDLTLTDYWEQDGHYFRYV